MSSHNPPPWLSDRRRPPSNLPSKRPADSRAQERPSKRSAPSTTAQEEAWVADEDRFVLQQAKKKAALRVKGNRAKPIDWLTVTLRFVDPTKTILDEEVEDHELDIVDSEGVIESLDEEELAELEKDIDTYLALETNRSNRDYWNAQKTICKDKRRRNRSSRSEARGTSSITSDIDRLLSPKSFEELETLEVQVKKKLDSDEPIDYDYWEQLLRNLRVWKAKAKLKKVSQQIINERLEALRRQQEKASVAAQEHFRGTFMETFETEEDGSYPMVYDSTLDPEPMLKLRPEDKSLEAIDDKIFSENLVDERRKILKLGYVPMRNKSQDAKTPHTQSKATQRGVDGLLRFAPVDTEDHSKATTALYEREVARGVEDGEEVFTGEEELNNTKPQWSGSYAPRKPRYFNRVQMGYEWNKYNQTHYDHDNPPPKVVQGYKFNIFYPDLIDKSKAPTYKIVRENGRKRGQSFAAAGEDDTCLIRFIAGPPYEDIAFRIVDKEWDYSAKRERGFKSSFDKVSASIAYSEVQQSHVSWVLVTQWNFLLTCPGHFATPFPVQKDILP
ncbi:hypothetical protein BU24DRAFT_62668 [Aaosphaeria arxii CBS 175.79]|uniref:Splicing factor Cactin n=1 Tax=Aaosphaeria arxii CBS 175.79 TaxID=1450172 RepID=A0A6A5XCR6_9PLEO|nr:uncharacterized protein BU24DRAFT_62668 [Aaosphaeria arxii CBS 175.79]KAF2010663.1 hypothetical protein BU24DRAFT_62668 [Aaosphaeria arxii CBS 175.79]